MGRKEMERITYIESQIKTSGAASHAPNASAIQDPFPDIKDLRSQISALRIIITSMQSRIDTMQKELNGIREIIESSPDEDDTNPSPQQQY